MASNSNVINKKQIGKMWKEMVMFVEIPRKLTQRKAVATVSILAEIRTGYLPNTGCALA